MTPKHVPASEGAVMNVLGDQVRIILAGADTGGVLTVIEQTGEPGYGIPLHVHEREDEVFTILAGQIEFQVADHTFTAEAGAVVLAPRAIPHSFRVTGTERARMHVSITPGGAEKMFAELSAISMPPAMERVGSICQSYGIRFLPPPESPALS